MSNQALPQFPPLTSALREPNGLLAVGGKLDPEWLLSAYSQGIFPWFNPGEPIMWWSPDPRMVLFPKELKISRSLQKTLRKNLFDVTFDQNFAAVMGSCAEQRASSGTWIGADMQQAYIQLHKLGWAHSVEAWQDDKLVGGLYGVAIGKVFFGESMFHRVTDASKVAFVHWVRYLEEKGYALIDCQMHTRHLESLGAREIERSEFARILEQSISL